MKDFARVSWINIALPFLSSGTLKDPPPSHSYYIISYNYHNFAEVNSKVCTFDYDFTKTDGLENENFC